MTGPEMVAAAIQLYGERGYVSALAAALGVDRSQVWRWSRLEEIPGPVDAAIKCWLAAQAN